MAEMLERTATRVARGWGAALSRRRTRATGDADDDASTSSNAHPSRDASRGGFRLVGRLDADTGANVARRAPRTVMRVRVPAFASLSAGMSPTENGDGDETSGGDKNESSKESADAAASSSAEDGTSTSAPTEFPSPTEQLNEGDPDQAIIGETVIYVEDDPESGLTKITVITSDRVNLMADIGSAFGSMGISVQYAEMRSGADGFVENAFVVTGPDLGPIKWESWERVKSRLKASCQKRGRSKPWQERESRLRELFSRIDQMGTGYIGQEDLDMFAQSLRMPRAFVHDFVDEGDQSGTGKMSFEEFAAFVRSKEISLQASFDGLNPDAKGRIKGSRLKKNLKNLEIRAGRYNTRKKIRAKGVERMLRYVDDETIITASDFRDMMILIPSGQLQTVSPYYMKVGLDIGPRRLPIPDRRKDGSPWGHLFAGGIAGVASRTMSSPLNVVAVRSIAGGGDGRGPSNVREIFTSMRGIVKAEGVRGLFKGNTANSVSSAPGKAIDFFAYAAYKGLLTGNGDREPTNVERLLAGSLAGMTSDTILYPLEVVSTRVTMDSGKYGGIAKALVSIAKKEGIKGLYAGWGCAMIGVVPYAGFSFGCYDILSAKYRETTGVDSAGALPTLFIGCLSGFLASTVSFPLYNATVKLQSGAAIAGLQGKATMMSVLTATMANGGPRALFKGWFPSAMKIVPQAGTSFVVYEVIKRGLDRDNFGNDDDDDDMD